MPTAKLTARLVAKLRAPDPSGRQKLFWDADLKGLGVLVSGASNAKTFVVQRVVGGKTRRITVGPTNVLSVDEARRRAETVLGSLLLGIDPKAARKESATLRTALDAYLTSNTRLRPTSGAQYRALVERHLAGWLEKPMSEITGDLVEREHRRIAEEASAQARHAGETGAALANLVFRAFRAIWNFAAERDADLPQNPVKRLRRQWFAVHRRERLVKASEMPAFYQAVCALPNSTHSAYLRFLLFTGLRRREAASLTWADVSLADRTFRIPAERTKAGRTLTLPMSDLVSDLLVAHGAQGREQYVFASNAKSRHIEEPKFALRQVAAATGVAVSAHDLRRTFATVAESADLSAYALKALLNHALPKSDVTGGYIQLTADRLREPTQRVADKLKVLCGIAPAAGDNVASLR
jgi:integrase